MSGNSFFSGKLAISAHQDNFTDIIEATQVLVDGGLHIGFLKDDYSFEIRNVVPGSYLVQVRCYPWIEHWQSFHPFCLDIV